MGVIKTAGLSLAVFSEEKQNGICFYCDGYIFNDCCDS